VWYISPHVTPVDRTQREQCQQTSEPHQGGDEQFAPLLIIKIGVHHQVAQQQDAVQSQYYRAEALYHPVVDAITSQIGDLRYHIHTPARTMATAEKMMIRRAPSRPPSRLSPISMSISRCRIPAMRS